MSNLNEYLEKNLIQYQDEFMGYISEHAGEPLSVSIKVKLANGKTIRHNLSGKMQCLLAHNLQDAEVYTKQKFRCIERQRIKSKKARSTSPSPSSPGFD